jgi:hypothetical protein
VGADGVQGEHGGGEKLRDLGPQLPLVVGVEMGGGGALGALRGAVRGERDRVD